MINMAEEPKEEDKKEETAEEEPSAADDVDRANRAAKRLEEANTKTEELVKRQEKLAVKSALGGSSDAGEPPAKPKVESAEDYAKRVLANEIETK